MESIHVAYDVPAGTENVLQFDTQLNGWLRDVRFVLGGRPNALRIRRIRGAQFCSPDLVFENASPHEVTVWFASNALVSMFDMTIHVTVDNLSSSSERLQITALGGELTNDPHPLGCPGDPDF